MDRQVREKCGRKQDGNFKSENRFDRFNPPSSSDREMGKSFGLFIECSSIIYSRVSRKAGRDGVSWKFVWIKFDGEEVKKKRKEKLKVQQYWDAYTISVYVIFPAIKRSR